MREAHAPRCRKACMPYDLHRSISTFGWRAQVCRYPMTIRARAHAHRTGSQCLGSAVLRRSGIGPLLALLRGGNFTLVRQVSDMYAFCLADVLDPRMSSARRVSLMPPGFFVSADDTPDCYAGARW